MHRLFSWLRVFLILLITAWFGLAWSQERGADQDVKADSGPNLESIEFSVAGMRVKVKGGGILALHPDAAFRVIKITTDAWLDLGLTARIKDMPDVDLTQFHTLAELLREQVYTKQELTVQALKGWQVLGKVQLLVRLLPIDWLRRAEAAQKLTDKIKYTKKALELLPDDRLLISRLVDLLVEAKQYREAAELLEDQGRLDDHPRALRRLADLYEKLGQSEKAAAVLSKLVSANPGDSLLMERLAKLYEQQSRWAEAAEIWQRLLQNQGPGPQRGEMYIRLAEVLTKADKEKEALAAWEQAVRLKPRDVKLWRTLAEVREKSGDQAGSLDALKRASALAPHDRSLVLSLAEGLLEAGKKKKAAVYMEKAFEQNPRDAALLLRLAKVYEEVKDHKALRQTYNRLAKLKPEDANLHYNLAVLAMDSGDYKQALASLEAAAKVRPEDIEIREMTLEVLLKLGLWDKAAKLALAMIKKKPSDLKIIEAVYPDLSQYLPDKMAGILDAALAAKPKKVKFYELRAALALDQDDKQAAITALEKGVKALPENLRLLFKLADLYEAEGKDDKALAALGKVLDKDPDFPKAQERYLQIKTTLMLRKKEAKSSGVEKD